MTTTALPSPARTTRATRMLATLGLLGLLGCVQPATAGRLVDVSIIDRSTGERLPTYRHQGKLYVAGTPGNAYAIELRGKHGERSLTVLSVDGVNVLTGETAAGAQSGYVLDGYESYSISGWRKSMNDVAKFVFTALPDSYAARTGRPQNVGVIGVAVYREKRPEPPPVATPPWSPLGKSAVPPAPTYESGETYGGLAGRNEAGSALADSLRAQESAAAPAATAARRDMASQAPRERRADKLGTGHGEREYAPTSYTEFVRASDSPDEVIAIYYDSRANLIARGIIRSPRQAEPNPFPGGIGFVPDPRG